MVDQSESLASYIRKVQELADEDKQHIVDTLAASEYYVAELGSDGQQVLQGAPEWVHQRSSSGVDISKQGPIAPEKTSKFRAAGVVKASVKDVKEFVLNQDLAPKYDPLFKHGQWLQLFHEDSIGVFKGFNHGLLGMSGLSAVCWDRDFVVLAVGMDLPNGGFVVHMTSLDEGHAQAVAPNPASHVVRGRIAQSSWVACPLQDGTTHVTNILQVDLKGSVPGFMTGMYGRTMATSMRRIEKEIGGMPPAMLESYRRKRKMLWDRTMRHPPHAQTRSSAPQASRAFGAVHPETEGTEAEPITAVQTIEDASNPTATIEAPVRRTFSLFNRKSAQVAV